ncbi:VanZ like family protein [Alicyclobacillus hesperidum]|uniref:VanZ like family protein n=1 Tax=Alicyclobacillus hesperidum TaxID=89784 RepID=A0A1H2YBK2_9BACL|nr:VanZ family protein [Alicyclobacillus hesperidum]SDX02198.1 VanZ like family protein [Alicyclobacillus hesperidum]
MLTILPIAIVSMLLYIPLSIFIGIKKRVSLLHQAIPFVFFVYLLIVIKITLFPISFHNLGNPPENNLIPFKTITTIIAAHSLSYDLYNIGGNIALFIPFGFLWPLVFRNKSKFLKVLLYGFFLSLLSESGKFIISCILGFTYRDFDVDDLILNTFGVILGYFFLRLVFRLQHLRSSTTLKTWYVASPIVILVLIGSLWGYEYVSHSTPQRAQQSYDANVLPLVVAPVSKDAVVIITSTDPRKTDITGYVAEYWRYIKLLGWRLQEISLNPIQNSVGTKEYSVSFIQLSKGTFAWGIASTPQIRNITYRHGGQVYLTHVHNNGFWYMVLPLQQNLVSHSNWSVEFKNGSIMALS